MRKSQYLYMVAFIVFILSLSGCIELHSGYVKPHTSATTAPAVSATPSYIPDKTQNKDAQNGFGIIVEATFCTDINSDDIEETVTVCSNSGSEKDVVLNVLSSKGSSKIEVNKADYKSAFITQTEAGSVCIFVSVSLGPRDFKTSIFSFDGIKPVFQREFNGHVTRVVNTEITVEDDLRIMGSWYYYRNYRLKDDFNFDPVTEYMITMEGKEPLCVAHSFSVEMLVDGVYVKKRLRAGTKVYPVSTDHCTYLKFRQKDGSAGKINFLMTGDHTFFIDGLNYDYDCFDNVEYWD